jgi:hypothetical protein
MKYHIIKPDGLVEVGQCTDKGLRYVDETNIVGGATERVKVLHEGRICDMVVNETGAVQDPPLPINARATAVYWSATRAGRTCLDFQPLTMPLIHGNAILYDGVRQ